MVKEYNKKLIPLAQSLRKNMTEQERRLWYTFLKTLPVNFFRQKVIGNYIVDFYCASQKLIIELDGSQHFEESGEQSDKKRDADLTAMGFTVVRYSNYQLSKEYEAVCRDILIRLGLEE